MNFSNRFYCTRTGKNEMIAFYLKYLKLSMRLTHIDNEPTKLICIYRYSFKENDFVFLIACNKNPRRGSISPLVQDQQHISDILWLYKQCFNIN